MTRSRQELLAKFNCKPPAGAETIQQVQAALHLALPGDYIEFLRFANGGEGFIDGLFGWWLAGTAVACGVEQTRQH